MESLLFALNLVFTLLWLVVLAHVIVSWVLDPYHEVRQFLDRIVQPMLEPIRRILPPTSGIDFSPLVLLIFLGLIQRVLRMVLT